MLIFKSKLVKIILNLAFFFLIFILVKAYKTYSIISSDVDVPEALSIQTLQGESRTIPLLGEQTLVYFFTPWCSICKYSVPNIKTIIEHKDVNVIVIALDYSETGFVEKFINNNDVNFPVYLGNEYLKSIFNIKAYPSYYLIDRDGKIVHASIGYTSSLELNVSTYLL